RAFVHDLKASNRVEVPVADADVQGAETIVRSLVDGLRARVYEAKPDGERCGRCDVSPMCKDSLASAGLPPRCRSSRTAPGSCTTTPLRTRARSWFSRRCRSCTSGTALPTVAHR